MSGSAVLDTTLVDSLLPVVDVLRDLNRTFGTRSWQVFTVKRTWSGARRGEGTSADVETEITPQPMVVDKRGRVLDPAGMHEENSVQLREVSLTYTETELLGYVGGDVPANVDWLYKLVGTHGQLQVTRYFEVGKQPPVADREKSIGWIVTLERAEGAD